MAKVEKDAQAFRQRRAVPALTASLLRDIPSSLAALPYLDYVVVEMFGVAVDQVDLLGMRVVHLLLVHLVCHGRVVGLVDVALFPDGNSIEMSLQRADGQERERGTSGQKKFSKRRTVKSQSGDRANLQA